MMKKNIWWIIVLCIIGVIAVVSWWLTREPDFEYHQRWWDGYEPEKEQVSVSVSMMKARLDTAKLAKYVYGDSLMVINYPDFFEVQEGARDVPDDSSVFFIHNTDSGFIYLRAMLTITDNHWTTEQWADTLAKIGQKTYGDTILLKDVHPGYFYLKGKHSDEYDGGRFYQQHIVQGDTVYMLSLFYSPIFEDEDVEKLTQLVHYWNPK